MYNNSSLCHTSNKTNSVFGSQPTRLVHLKANLGSNNMLLLHVNYTRFPHEISQEDVYDGRNSKGYDMAKLFTSKFTHLSPVWYDLKRYVTLLIN